MDLQPLFQERIRSSHHYEDLHPGQASDVWCIETDQESVIVRTTRMTDQPLDEFWFGVRELFGIDPTDVFAMEVINRTLQSVSKIPVPKVLRTERIGAVPFVIVEMLPGNALLSFSNLRASSLTELGLTLGSIHQVSRDTCGNFSGTFAYFAHEFHHRLVQVMPQLVRRYHAHDAAVVDSLSEFLQRAARTESPKYAVPILLDMDPTQFLAQDGKLTGLIDTEVYAFGPAELDLVALEYLLDERSAGVFVEGYERVRPFPKLDEVRPLYRYLNRLLCVQGAIPLEDWMTRPNLFP